MERSLVVFLLPLIFFVACDSATQKIKDEYKPIARAEIGEIILVMDSLQWENNLGDQMRKMFRTPMRGLPQDEPLFDLHKVNPLKFNRIFETATNLIFVMTLDSKSAQSRELREFFTDNSLKMIQRDSSLFMTIKEDEFAKGQIVLFLFSQSEELLSTYLEENKTNIIKVFETAARERMREKVLAQKEQGITKYLKEEHGYEIQIPYGWDLAKNEDHFSWIRFLEADSERNIFIYYEPYSSRAIFNNLGEYRDKVTTRYLRDSQKPEIYVDRQEIVPVFTERVNYSGNFAVESRGLWKVSDNSGGGPYVSYTIVDEAAKLVFYVEGYVYSPGTKKRDLVREVESIITTFKTPTSVNKK